MNNLWAFVVLCCLVIIVERQLDDGSRHIYLGRQRFDCDLAESTSKRAELLNYRFDFRVRSPFSCLNGSWDKCTILNNSITYTLCINSTTRLKYFNLNNHTNVSNCTYPVSKLNKFQSFTSHKIIRTIGVLFKWP